MKDKVIKEIATPHVLFVDDNRSDLFLVDLIIKIDKIDAIPHFEMNGIAALDYLNRLKGTSSFPQFIFVDLNMPLKNGFEFVEDLNLHFPEYIPYTQIYILSSSFRETDKQKARRIKSIKSYIEKPLESPLLSSILQGDKYF